MKALVIYSNGHTEETDVTRLSLSREFSINNRDLRPIFLLKQIATILVREHCSIVNLGTIKCIIARDKAYFLHIDDSQTIVQNIIDRISTQANEQIATFEFFVLESTLLDRVEYFKKKYSFTERNVNSLLAKLKDDFSEEHLERLLAMKKNLSELEMRVEETQNTLIEIMEDEEDIEHLNISRTKQTKAETEKVLEEVENIFENYLEQFEDISHKIEALSENIDDTQEFITLKMANIRNTIIRMDLIIGIVTAAFAFPTALVGLYGMNITNKLEQSHQAFLAVTSVIIIFLLLTLLVSWLYLKRKKII